MGVDYPPSSPVFVTVPRSAALRLNCAVSKSSSGVLTIYIRLITRSFLK